MDSPDEDSTVGLIVMEPLAVGIPVTNTELEFPALSVGDVVAKEAVVVVVLVGLGLGASLVDPVVGPTVVVADGVSIVGASLVLPSTATVGKEAAGDCVMSFFTGEYVV